MQEFEDYAENPHPLMILMLSLVFVVAVVAVLKYGDGQGRVDICPSPQNGPQNPWEICRNSAP